MESARRGINAVLNHESLRGNRLQQRAVFFVKASTWVGDNDAPTPRDARYGPSRIFDRSDIDIEPKKLSITTSLDIHAGTGKRCHQIPQLPKTD